MRNHTASSSRSLDGLCVFPECEASQTEHLSLPLCTKHILKTYRLADQIVQRTMPRFTTKARPLQGRRSGFVYIIRFSGMVKIGFSSNVAMRLTAIPHDEILATFPGTMRDEKALHERFAHLRHKGEWFRPGDDLLAYAASKGLAE